MSKPHRRLAAALLPLSLLLSVVPWASATETITLKNSPAKSSHDTDSNSDGLGRLHKKTAPAKLAASAAAAAEAAGDAEAGDPIDRLRERLAQRLGAARSTSPNPNVVRVVSRPPSEGSAVALPPGVRIDPPLTEMPAPRVAHAPQPRSAPKPRVSTVTDRWAYDGDAGPDSWAKMAPEFSACAAGKRQSPIDIRDGISVQLDPVLFDYKPTNFRVIDTGHTVQVNVGQGNSIEVQGRRYELVQFHFHRPSEERINGRQFDMAVHLVHRDPEGKLAYLAVMLERGRAQPLVQAVWNNLPLEKGDEVVAKTTLDLNSLLPTDRRYYTYMGSLTTPPCTEGVLWVVMQNPVPISPEQDDIFARLYPMNARPVQSAGGRLIKGSALN